jgi:hypothetical protein
VRQHAWYGPRQPESGWHLLAAALEVEKSVVDGVLSVDVTTRNVGCGHALPTGEPLRSVLLLVEATCDGSPLAAIGGDVVPDFGGYRLRKPADEDWSTWPGGTAGDVVRVVRRTGAFIDYEGYGAFGDGTFDARAKGMPVEEIVGTATILSMEGDVATFDADLPTGDFAYLGDAAEVTDGGSVAARAGAPGFGFARVLVGPDGRRMVPHFLAVDVASDNRLLPMGWATTHHSFATPCENPVVTAMLVQRAVPYELVQERGWATSELILAEATR